VFVKGREVEKVPEDKLLERLMAQVKRLVAGQL
jgi:hypothetical protein